MRLDWTYDIGTRTAKTVINDELYYTTIDGGQTIDKYVDGELVRTFHKYGPDKKYTTKASNGWHNDELRTDSWTGEVVWLSRYHHASVGKLYSPWVNGIKNKHGELELVGTSCGGFGVTNPEELISVCRLVSPADTGEWWDWDIIATNINYNDDDTYNEGVVWRKHKTTGQIVRVGSNQCHIPTCVYPTIHGPFVVSDSDIIDKYGTRVKT